MAGEWRSGHGRNHYGRAYMTMDFDFGYITLLRLSTATAQPANQPLLLYEPVTVY